jgi:hypothetical protein
MPRQNPRVMHSFTDETLAQIADLAILWGGVGDLPKSQVIREAIRRCWLAEQEQAKNGKKKKDEFR